MNPNIQPDDPHDVVIVGAGLSGLSAAYSLRQCGMDSLILEKETRIAEPWRKRHPQLCLNTHRKLSSLPGYALAKDGPAFPSRDEVVDYLERYTEATRANVRFGTRLEELRPLSGYWELRTSTGTLRAHNVLFTTGKEHQPKIPNWPGMGTWSGRLLHSATLGDVRQYAGKHVLVVGAGNSGTDVLNHLVRVPTRSLHVSVREGSVVVPTWFLGFPVQLGAPFMEKLPLWLIDLMLAGTERMAFGNLRRLGFPARAGGASRLAGDGTSPAIDRGFIAALKAGEATIIPAIDHFEERAVVLRDGRKLQPDVVIAATGYETGLVPLLGKLGILNDRGLPRTDPQGEAYGAPGLWFAGMSPRLSGYFHSAKHNSPRLAMAIATRMEHERYMPPESVPASRDIPALQPAE
jgi:cation diffusion facilitator CzcD-associated flavoprotein CzcO